MAQCLHCKKVSLLISSPLDLCLDCILSHFDQVKPHLDRVHARVRRDFGLPEFPSDDPGDVACNLCANQCRIPEGGRGYCGTRLNMDGELLGGRSGEGNFSSYYDPLPTNCVADWVCPGGTGCGFPQYSHSKGSEKGFKNLAVFFKSCTFNCLFCQNWHYREESLVAGRQNTAEIVGRVDDRTSCVCYFGGDPTPHILFALEASQLALERYKDGILRICWETNGSMNPYFLEKAAALTLESGGCIKFDLKAWHRELHYALCGISNRQTLSNFAELAKYIPERPSPPFLVASTLLVPGYVDEEEVRNIASFIAALDPNIPYSLLGFCPHFEMQDLPRTSIKHAERCRKAALESGLKRVKVGNIHLLGDRY